MRITTVSHRDLDLFTLHPIPPVDRRRVSTPATKGSERAEAHRNTRCGELVINDADVGKRENEKRSLVENVGEV